MNITIIGSKGQMGAFLLEKWKEKHQVKGIDKEDELEVADANIIVICVPLSIIPTIVNALRPLVTKEQLVFEIGAVKKGHISVLRKLNCRTASCHPLFGNHVKDFNGQNLAVITDVGKREDRQVVMELFAGTNIVEISSKEHDSAMLYALCLPFILRKVFGKVVVPDKIKGLTTPSYRRFDDYLKMTSENRKEAYVVDEILRANKERVRSLVKRIRKAVEKIEADMNDE